jgi:methionyl aminopeptidase
VPTNALRHPPLVTGRWREAIASRKGDAQGSTMVVKSEREWAAMRAACGVVSTVLQEVVEFIRPGLTTKEIDAFAASQIKSHGARSAFLNYRKYPCNICISVNEQVVHGLAGDRRVEFGDIISLDVGVFYNGFVGDIARTVAVGGCGVAAQHLMDITEQALYKGIAQAVPGNRVVDISRAIQNYVEHNGFSVVREFVGHGVGRKMHEDPQIPNFVEAKASPKLRPGMTLAIEPMVNAGQPAVKLLNDGWTAVTQDGSLSAHFEHTVVVAEPEPEVLTWHERMPSKLKAS